MRTRTRLPRLVAGHRVPGLLLLATASALAVSACGSSSPSSTASSSPSSSSASSSSSSPSGDAGSSSPAETSSGAAHGCGDVPASRVNAALGITVGAPSETRNGTVTVCSYDGNPTHLIVRFQTGVSSLANEKQQSADSGQHPQDLPGVGDEAFSSSLGNGAYMVNTVTARKGGLEILVTTQAPLQKEVALVQQLLG